MLHVTGKLQGIEALTARFKDLPNVVDKATASALNKLGRQGRTAANKGIRETYNIKAGEINKAISLVPAKASYGGRQKRLFTTLYIKGSRLGLHKFGGLPSSPVSQKGIPVKRRREPTVKILIGTARRKVTPDKGTGHQLFVARMTGGFGGSETDHVGIFYRTNIWVSGNKWRGGNPKAKHQVIREKKSKGIAESFLSHGRDQLDQLIVEKGAETIQKELNYFLSKQK
jgi:hypothetical protein